METLRNHLNSAGFEHIQVIVNDGLLSEGALKPNLCETIGADAIYNASVSIVGLHYPSDYDDYSTCHALNKPLWSSEESSSYDDLNGASCLARVMVSHWVLSKITSNIIWNLVGSYAHGTNWYASSIMTADQPWSGNFKVSPVLWVVAHVTQFTQIGWRYLTNGSGSGQLPKGGFYQTIVDAHGADFTMHIVKIDRDHAPCTRPPLPDFDVYAEDVTVELDASMFHSASILTLSVWQSNFMNFTTLDCIGSKAMDVNNKHCSVFRRQNNVIVLVTSPSFTVHVPVGAFLTISTILEGPTRGAYTSPTSNSFFPLPHADDFNSYPEDSEARYFADQIGAFEVHLESKGSTNKVMKQMVPMLPVGWKPDARGPITIIGMREWQDVHVSVDFKLPKNEQKAAGCVVTRSDQQWYERLRGFLRALITCPDWDLLTNVSSIPCAVCELFFL